MRTKAKVSLVKTASETVETGSGDAFEAATALYVRYGFERCPPFGDYREDPFSRFMTLAL